MTYLNVLNLLGGLAVFLYGMTLMGSSLEKQAGSRLEAILASMTASPIRGFLLGLGVTAVIQSSGATTVMVVGFVNSGIMQLHQAIGIIMGANVGTTVTAWILSLTGINGSGWVQLLKPSSFSPVLAFIGILLFLGGRSEKRKGVGSILLGFALLMFGMETMSSAMAPLSGEEWFTSLFLRFTNPILGILAGFVLTTMMQSSSASVGVLQALALTGGVSYGAVFPIIMGQNIGSTVTALISSFGANKNARRTALVHLYFNIIGVVIIGSIFYALHAVMHFAITEETATPAGIAITHSAFNIVTTALLLPFGKVLERLAILTVPDDDAPEKVQLLDERLLATPAMAAGQAHAVTAEMAELARVQTFKAMSLTHNWDEALAAEILATEEIIDSYEDKLGTYLVKLSSRSMNRDVSAVVNTLLHTIADFERIGDHAVDVLHSAKEIHEKNVEFSAAAQHELGVLEAAIRDIIDHTVACFKEGDLDGAQKIEPLEEVVDDLVREVRERHIARLQNGACSIQYGFILGDLLTNYERSADHCSNVAVAMLRVAEGTFDTHEYLDAIKSGDDTTFDEQFRQYRSRYPLDQTAV